MSTQDTAQMEPLHAAIMELGRRYSSGEITRQRRDARLAELSAPDASLRRRRPRAPLSALPAARLPPVTFYSIERAEAG